MKLVKLIQEARKEFELVKNKIDYKTNIAAGISLKACEDALITAEQSAPYLCGLKELNKE